ncbi:hypothetical protein [Lysobacter gummosus]
MTIFIRLSPHRLSIRAQDSAPPRRHLAGTFAASLPAACRA